MEGILTKTKDAAKKYSMFIAFAVVIIVFQIWTEGILLVPQNVTNLIQQNSYVVILAIGMLMCIITGGNIDLSVGSVAGVVGAIAAKMCVEGNASPLIAIVVALLIGLGAGALNGYLIAYRGIPAFIVTMAAQLIYRGLTQAILAGRTLSPFPDTFKLISSGFIPDFLGGAELNLASIAVGLVLCPIVVLLLVKSRRESISHNANVEKLPLFIAKLVLFCGVIILFTYWLARYEGIPNVLILLAVQICIYAYFTNQTVLGRHLYAMGGNAKAAQLSGVKTKRLLFLAFVNMGFLAALAGVVFAGRLNAATPKAGTGFEMDAIASCYIGGASSSGGSGTVAGAVIGALLMGVLNNGMSIMGIDTDWQSVIKGIVLLVAVIFDTLSKNKSKR